MSWDDFKVIMDNLAASDRVKAMTIYDVCKTFNKKSATFSSAAANSYSTWPVNSMARCPS